MFTSKMQSTTLFECPNKGHFNWISTVCDFTEHESIQREPNPKLTYSAHTIFQSIAVVSVHKNEENQCDC